MSTSIKAILKSLSIDQSETNVYIGDNANPLCVIKLSANTGAIQSTKCL